MKKEILVSLIICLIICGCSKKVKTYDENGKNDFPIVTTENITVTGTSVVKNNDTISLKTKIVNNKYKKCVRIEINILDENDNILKTYTIPVNGEIFSGEEFIVDEEYYYDNMEPNKMEIKYITES